MVKLRGLCCLFLFVCPAAVALTVTTTVDRDHVRPGESVIVTYTVDEQVSEPNFVPIEKDFEIIDTARGQNVVIANSQARYELTWTLSLMPKGTGELSLPGIRFGHQLSETRTITVLDDSLEAEQFEDIHIDYSVDDLTPYVNQQVLLTTKVYTSSEVDSLDISTPQVVEGSATIDKLGRGRQYHSVRGSRRYTVHEQRYTLVPKSTGVLKLGPIEIESTMEGSPVRRRSEPLELEVLHATAPEPREKAGELEARDLFMEIDVDKQSPYVQEQVLYIVRLFRAIALENATMSTPSVSGGDAVIDRIGGDRRYQTTRDNRRYAVTERRFVLFPQTSGTLTIDPVRLQASVALPGSGSNSTGFWSRPLTKPVRVQTEPYELTVKVPPADAPSPWLPASQMTLVEEWPETEKIEVGTPITRRIVLKAESLLASQLPELDIPLPDTVRSYPERPQRQNEAADNGVRGRLEQTIAVIPSQPGDITIPPFELSWWNTSADRKETLRLPARTLNVQATAATPPLVSSPRESAGDVSQKNGTLDAHIAWWISAAFGTAWLLTLLMWWRDRRRGGAGLSTASSGVGESRRRAEDRLKSACQSGDSGAARDALLAWARACWPEHPPRSLGAIGNATNDEISAQLSILQKALYAPGENDWHGDGLYRLVSSFRPDLSHGRGDDGGLRALYQH